MNGLMVAKSGLSRQGLQVMMPGAHYLNPGYKGNFPLQLLNQAPYPIRLTKRMVIAQLILQPLQGDVHFPYSDAYNTYQHDDQPTARHEPSKRQKLWDDFVQSL
jgi:deoxycytidine triphosphate deaminase